MLLINSNANTYFIYWHSAAACKCNVNGIRIRQFGARYYCIKLDTLQKRAKIRKSVKKKSTKTGSKPVLSPSPAALMTAANFTSAPSALETSTRPKSKDQDLALKESRQNTAKLSTPTILQTTVTSNVQKDRVMPTTVQEMPKSSDRETKQEMGKNDTLNEIKGNSKETELGTDFPHNSDEPSPKTPASDDFASGFSGSSSGQPDPHLSESLATEGPPAKEGGSPAGGSLLKGTADIAGAGISEGGVGMIKTMMEKNIVPPEKLVKIIDPYLPNLYKQAKSKKLFDQFEVIEMLVKSKKVEPEILSESLVKAIHPSILIRGVENSMNSKALLRHATSKGLVQMDDISKMTPGAAGGSDFVDDGIATQTNDAQHSPSSTESDDLLKKIGESNKGLKPESILASLKSSGALSYEQLFDKFVEQGFLKPAEVWERLLENKLLSGPFDGSATFDNILAQGVQKSEVLDLYSANDVLREALSLRVVSSQTVIDVIRSNGLVDDIGQTPGLATNTTTRTHPKMEAEVAGTRSGKFANVVKKAQQGQAKKPAPMRFDKNFVAKATKGKTGQSKPSSKREIGKSPVSNASTVAPVVQQLSKREDASLIDTLDDSQALLILEDLVKSEKLNPTALLSSTIKDGELTSEALIKAASDSGVSENYEALDSFIDIAKIPLPDLFVKLIGSHILSNEAIIGQLSQLNMDPVKIMNSIRANVSTKTLIALGAAGGLAGGLGLAAHASKNKDLAKKGMGMLGSFFGNKGTKTKSSAAPTQVNPKPKKHGGNFGMFAKKKSTAVGTKSAPTNAIKVTNLVKGTKTSKPTPAIAPGNKAGILHKNVEMSKTTTIAAAANPTSKLSKEKTPIKKTTTAKIAKKP